ncbi:MAG: HlyC/CorC family transporter [Chloroflexi bacterium]|nr:HlyC/CorC family transporter [Chloroflexota bacterium]
MFVNTITIFGVVSLCIFFNALYVAAEFSTVSSRRTRISQMAGQGNRMAQLLHPIVEDRQKLDTYVATSQVGITLSSLIVGAYGQNVIARSLIAPVSNLLNSVKPILNSVELETSETFGLVAANTIAVILVLIFITVLQVILGELFPKSVALQHPEKLASAWFIVLPMFASQILFSPLIWFFNGSGALILRAMGRSFKEKAAHAHSPEEIELLVTESHESGLLDDEERMMLRNAFRLRDLTARQVMVHRTKMIAAPVETAVLDLMKTAIAAGYSRIPIFQETIDDVIGFVHVKDLFKLHVQQETSVKPNLRDVVYVPETMPVAQVWERLSSRRKYLAIVFDEYGGTSGLITFEDLIEEIFGELQDEFDDEMAPYARDKEGRVYLRGDLLIVDVNEYWELNLPNETADTLSGLIFSELGRQPQPGDEITFDNITLQVEAMEDQAVSEISLCLPQENDTEPIFIEWEAADHE